jgi:hypothetical protein
MELTIGSNVIRNTSGILSIQGKDQVHLARGNGSDELLLTMNLYNAGGKHVARLWENAWTFDDTNQFEITARPGVVRLTDRGSGQVVLEARVGGDDRVEIPQGVFHTHTGDQLEITPKSWTLKGVSVGEKTIDCDGDAVAIG